MDERYVGGRRRGRRGREAAGKLPVFGILERGGKVKVEVVPEVWAEPLLREAWVEAFWALVEELMGEGGGGGGMAWLGGRGWLRLVQQNTACELNSMPQLGDYRTFEGAVKDVIMFTFAGCLGLAAAGPEGCMAGLVAGLVAGLWYFYFSTKEAFEVDLTRWCRQNYTVCRDNEYYRAACEEVIEVQ